MGAAVFNVMDAGPSPVPGMILCMDKGTIVDAGPPDGGRLFALLAWVLRTQPSSGVVVLIKSGQGNMGMDTLGCEGRDSHWASQFVLVRLHLRYRKAAKPGPSGFIRERQLSPTAAGFGGGRAPLKRLDMDSESRRCYDLCMSFGEARNRLISTTKQGFSGRRVN